MFSTRLPLALLALGLVGCIYDTGGALEGDSIDDTIGVDATIDPDAPPIDPELDAAPDASEPIADAAPPPIDAALPIADASLPPAPDASLPPAPDASLPPPADAAPPPPPDASTPPPPDAAPPLPDAGMPDQCGPVVPITLGQNTSGSTSGPSLLAGTCGGGSQPEDVFSFTVASLSDVTVTTEIFGTAFDTLLYVRRDCDDPGTELGCLDTSGLALGDTLVLNAVPPGTYHAVVDGTGIPASGNYVVRVTVTPIPVEMCEAAATPVTLAGPPNTQSGSTSTSGDYAPACLAGFPSGGEDVFATVIPAGGPFDLVAEARGQGSMNPVLDISPVCGDVDSSLACATAATGGGSSEVAVVNDVGAGDEYFVVVDSAGNGNGGDYQLDLFTRHVLGAGQACDRAARRGRCATGVCVDGADADDLATCTTGVMTLGEGSGNFECENADGPASSDFVYQAQITSGSDIDVVEIVPPVNVRLVATALTPGAACQIDLQMQLTHGECGDSLDMVAQSQDDGLGPCPLIDTGNTKLQAGEHYWLIIRRTPNFGTGQYRVVVDLIP